ncbi:MAG: molybdopterin molybdotransferase MoeA [Oscillospiraceae bacterium]|nr:molybdopterin molybdotransferase MoeA [Oscillospiraceae bacterium]
MRKNLHPDEAARLIAEMPVKIEKESVALERCVGRVLAEDVFITIPAPPFDRSPFDGYALRAADTAGASSENPVTLTITEELPAGTEPTMPVGKMQAAKILTGAPIPVGADTVIKYEETEFTDKFVKIFTPLKADTNIVYRGEDVPEGSLAAAGGSIICAATAGIFASQGLAFVDVVKKPRVAIINTGTELLRPGDPPQPAKIYNSNAQTVAGYLEFFGAEPVQKGTVEDDPKLIAEKISDAFRTCDMVITTGGASVGDYDWAVGAAELLGAEVLFWKTNMKPGGSLMAANCGGKLLLGLSGNPGAALLGLIRVALPYLKKLCGKKDIYPRWIKAYLSSDVKKASPKLRILRGRLKIEDGKAVFEEMDGQGNGTMSSFIGCDLLGQIPAGSPPVSAGTLIEAMVIEA